MLLAVRWTVYAYEPTANYSDKLHPYIHVLGMMGMIVCIICQVNIIPDSPECRCFIINAVFEDADEEICKFTPIWIAVTCQGVYEDEWWDKQGPKSNSVTQKSKHKVHHTTKHQNTEIRTY